MHPACGWGAPSLDRACMDPLLWAHRGTAVRGTVPPAWWVIFQRVQDTVRAGRGRQPRAAGRCPVADSPIARCASQTRGPWSCYIEWTKKTTIHLFTRRCKEGRNSTRVPQARAKSESHHEPRRRSVVATQPPSTFCTCEVIGVLLCSVYGWRGGEGGRKQASEDAPAAGWHHTSTRHMLRSHEHG